jgi:hypothetical protein
MSHTILTGAGRPTPGAQIGLALSATIPNAMAFLCMGLDDFGNGGLPAALPGSCLLHVRPDLLLPLSLNFIGQGRLLLTVPTSPTILGAHLFSQGLMASNGSTSVSPGVVTHIGL